MAKRKLTEKEIKKQEMQQLDYELNKAYNNYVLDILNNKDVLGYEYVEKIENKLKEISMDLNQWEQDLSKDFLGQNGKFESQRAECMYLTTKTTRKHIELLLYFIEKYNVKKGDKK